MLSPTQQRACGRLGSWLVVPSARKPTSGLPFPPPLPSVHHGRSTRFDGSPRVLLGIKRPNFPVTLTLIHSPLPTRPQTAVGTPATRQRAARSGHRRTAGDTRASFLSIFSSFSPLFSRIRHTVGVVTPPPSTWRSCGPPRWRRVLLARGSVEEPRRGAVDGTAADDAHR